MKKSKTKIDDPVVIHGARVLREEMAKDHLKSIINQRKSSPAIAPRPDAEPNLRKMSELDIIRLIGNMVDDCVDFEDDDDGAEREKIMELLGEAARAGTDIDAAYFAMGEASEALCEALMCRGSWQYDDVLEAAYKAFGAIKRRVRARSYLEQAAKRK